MPTLLDYWKACADEYGGLDLFTTTGVAADTTHLVCSTIADAGADSTRYASAWAYILSGPLIGQQRRIKPTGFDGTTGTLEVTAAFTGTPGSGVQVAVLSGIPVLRVGTLPGWKDLINDTLRAILIESWEDRTGDGTDSMELSGWEWLRHSGALLSVNQYGTGVSWPTEIAHPWRLRVDANRVYLEIAGSAFIANGEYPCHLLRPADTWIARSSTWASRTGAPDDALTTDTDEAVPGVTYVRAGAMERAYRFRRTKLRDGNTDEVKRLEEQFAREFARMQAERTPKMDRVASAPRVGVSYRGAKDFWAL